MRVFVTDADYKHALGAVRSLGSRGIEVFAGSTGRRAQSFYSRYASGRVVHPPPSDEEAFVGFLRRYAREHGIDVVLPIGYESNVSMSKNLEQLGRTVNVPVAKWENLQIAADKARSLEFAHDLGIPIPTTFSSIEEVDQFPAVAKGALGSGRVRYLNSPADFESSVRPHDVLQEYIPGAGYGFYALFRQGEARAIFMHRRIREFPVTGGASTAAESIYDPHLRDLGLRLLEALHWHGVAMVEFKKDIRDGEYKLMEINPKFWGSLDLAIAAGVDFPYLAATMAFTGDVEPVFEYRAGIRYHWPLPDEVLHILARPASLPAVVRDSLDPSTRSNVWRKDLRPNLFQAGLTAAQVLVYSGTGRLLAPHGRPRTSP